jgi:hypothetical protein
MVKRWQTVDLVDQFQNFKKLPEEFVSIADYDKLRTALLEIAESTQCDVSAEIASHALESQQSHVGASCANWPCARPNGHEGLCSTNDTRQDCRTIAGRGICDMCAQGDFDKCRYSHIIDKALARPDAEGSFKIGPQELCPYCGEATGAHNLAFPHPKTTDAQRGLSI